MKRLAVSDFTDMVSRHNAEKELMVRALYLQGLPITDISVDDWLCDGDTIISVSYIELGLDYIHFIDCYTGKEDFEPVTLFLYNPKWRKLSRE